MSFTARYTGRCASCHLRVDKGDLVRFDDDHRIIHNACAPADDPTVLRRTEEVCGVCWTVKPCRCDD